MTATNGRREKAARRLEAELAGVPPDADYRKMGRVATATRDQREVRVGRQMGVARTGCARYFKPKVEATRPQDKAIFKLAEGEETMRRNIRVGLLVNREVAAWKVATLVGMDDLVPAVVTRDVEGLGYGVAAEFHEGTEARKMRDVHGDYPYGDHKTIARAAAFDYVIGNEDRHAGNWLAKNERGKGITLIDHNLTFPEGPYYASNQNYVKRAHSLDENLSDEGLAPKDMAAPYLAAQKQIEETLKKLGLEESVPGVIDRIKKLSRESDWRGLPGT